jgi:formamidopyrimidine-DNA glycosylase
MYYTVEIHPPPCSVSQYNNNTIESALIIKMSKELLLQHQEHVNPLQNEKDFESKERIKIHDNIEQEIECPRCYDIMALSSEFDKMSYFCQECNLSLLIN